MQPNAIPLVLVGVFAGLFSIAGAWFNWEWFMNSPRARPIVWLFGRDGARAFYALLGVAMIVVAIVIGLSPCPG